MEHRDTAGVISLVTKREPILRAVGTDGVGKRELVDQLLISRSTVDRGIRELESAALLARSGEGYRRTLLGELLLAEYDRFASTTAALLNGREVLAELPPGFELEPVLFEDATIVTASQHAPQQPISALCSVLDEGRWTQTVLPAVFPQVLDEWVALCDEEMARADIVLTDPVVSTLVGSHSESLQRLLDESRIALHQVEIAPAYGLVVAETESTATAGLVILDDRGGARAFIETETDEAISWIREAINDHLMQSTPLSSPSPERE
jgi:predicted transcriptional regulator